MDPPRGWREELGLVVDLMRDLSRQHDAQAASLLYSDRLRRSGLITSDGYLSVSRRGLAPPRYRMTRSTRWKEPVNPWLEQHRLPEFDTGLLGELLYSNEPVVIENLPRILSSHDPAIAYLDGFELLATAPYYEDGQAVNMGVLLVHKARTFSFERYPGVVWQANLWGRGVHNLVLRRQLEAAEAELRQANAALTHELQTVGEVQQSLLPSNLPDVPGLELAAHYQTSQRSGGDYYDFFICGDGRLGILMADVSGHGASAAVVMAVTHAIIHLHPGGGVPPGAVLSFVNRTLWNRYTPAIGKFVTAFFGTYDPGTRVLTFAVAGHPPPRLVRRGVIGPLLGEAGLPLGIQGDEAYPETTIQLEAGDSLVIYTDGVTEARNQAGDFFGAEGLDTAVSRADGNPAELIRQILGALKEFTSDKPAEDDRTVVALAIRDRG